MTDDELRHAYDVARKHRRTAPQQATVPLERLQALVSGTVPIAEREAMIEQTLLSGASDELALLHSVAAGSPPSVSWRKYWPMAAAAVLLVAVSVPVMRSVNSSADAPGFRGSDSVAGTPLLRAPVVGARESTAFAWTAVPDADRYVLELLDGNGEVLVHLETRDTLASVVTDSLAIPGRAADGWWVIAKLRDGTERRSALRRFSERPAK